MACTSHRIGTMTTTTAQTIACLEAFATDPTAPAAAVVDVADWLHRERHARQLAADAHQAGRVAREQLEAGKRQAPHRVVAALAAGPVGLEAVGADLPKLRAAVDQAEDRYAIAKQAANICHLQLTGPAFERHADLLLPWCASQRAAVSWWQPVPNHVAAVWAAIGSRWALRLPLEACTIDGPSGPRLVTASRLRLVIDRHDRRTAGLPFDAMYWAWSCIVQGEYRVTDGRPGSLHITGDWQSRPALEALPASRDGRQAARRFFGIVGAS